MNLPQGASSGLLDHRLTGTEKRNIRLKVYRSIVTGNRCFLQVVIVEIAVSTGVHGARVMQHSNQLYAASRAGSSDTCGLSQAHSPIGNLLQPFPVTSTLRTARPDDTGSLVQPGFDTDFGRKVDCAIGGIVHHHPVVAEAGDIDYSD